MTDPADMQLAKFLREPAETEWLELKQAKNDFDTDDMGRYVSALANEANLLGKDAGWLVFGVANHIDSITGMRAVVGSRHAATVALRNEIKQRIAHQTSPSVGLSDPIEVLHPDCPTGTRVLMWRIPPAPQGMPVAWKGHYWGRAGESLVPLPLNKLDALRAQSSLQDWSAVLTTDDWNLLDPAAISRAQELYRRRHATHPQVLSNLAHRSVADWMHDLRLAVGGRLTRAALVLMGKPEAVVQLDGPTPKLTWVLVDHAGEIQAHQHFELPLILANDALVARIRIIQVSVLPPRQTAPFNLPNYDDWVIREALHNCIAHQDYTLGGRSRVTESPESLTFFNLGSFLPGSVARVLAARQPEQRYRNACLANAMVELDLIETLSSGVPKMFRVQQQRFFPLPDFEFGNQPDSVSVRIYGKTLDERYIHALMTTTDLSLEDAILLDRIQKKLPLAADQVRRLRDKGLVEGRGKKISISARIAAATGQEVAYINHKGLDAKHYKGLVLDLLALGPQPRTKINAMLLSKLPASIPEGVRQREYIKNLLQELARDHLIENMGGQTRAALWRLKA